MYEHFWGQIRDLKFWQILCRTPYREVSFQPCFLIFNGLSNASPQSNLIGDSKIPKPNQEASSSRSPKGIRGGENWIKNSIPNPIPSCTSHVHYSNCVIGEIYGFKVALWCGLDAMRNGGANKEGVRRGGRQQWKCNGAYPPIDKNWWGVLTMMMTKKYTTNNQ